LEEKVPSKRKEEEKNVMYVWITSESLNGNWNGLVESIPS